MRDYLVNVRPRRKLVKELVDLGFMQYRIAEFLAVSVATLVKDYNALGISGLRQVGDPFGKSLKRFAGLNAMTDSVMK